MYEHELGFVHLDLATTQVLRSLAHCSLLTCRSSVTSVRFCLLTSAPLRPCSRNLARNVSSLAFSVITKRDTQLLQAAFL